MKLITLGTSHGDPTVNRFNVSTLLLETSAGRFLIDAGAPAAALLIRRGVPVEFFFSHLNEDHFGGISGILK